MHLTSDTGLVKTDEDGERIPAPLSGFQWLEAFLRFGLTRREVPASFWSAQGGLAVVDCACATQVKVPLAAFPEPCQCGRWFFYDGTVVWALLGPSHRGA